MSGLHFMCGGLTHLLKGERGNVLRLNQLQAAGAMCGGSPASRSVAACAARAPQSHTRRAQCTHAVIIVHSLTLCVSTRAQVDFHLRVGATICTILQS